MVIQQFQKDFIKQIYSLLYRKEYSAFYLLFITGRSISGHKKSRNIVLE